MALLAVSVVRGFDGLADCVDQIIVAICCFDMLVLLYPTSMDFVVLYLKVSGLFFNKSCSLSGRGFGLFLLDHTVTRCYENGVGF